MDIRKVKKLIEMLEESQIAEIEIHEGEESVRISRQSNIVGTPVQTVIQAPGNEPRLASATTPVTTSEVVESEPEEGQYITSPMVGLFYAAPAPGKPAFIELGNEIKKGDVVCIIEAMKIMNQVESDISGVVSKILVENGEPVEFGQPLFLVREA